MAQIAIIPPAPAQSAPPGPPAGGDDSLFSPHLDNAMANTRSPQNPPAKKPHSAVDQHDIDNQSAAAESVAGKERIESRAAEIPHRGFAGNNGSDSIPYGNKSRQHHGLQQIHTDPSFEGVKQVAIFSPPQPNRFTPANGVLLERLRQIISNSSEKGVVAISRASVAVSADTGVTGTGEPGGDTLIVAPERAAPQLDSLRQNLKQQYYQARVTSDAVEEEATAAKNNSQQSSHNSGSQNGEPAAHGSIFPQQNSGTSGTAFPTSLSHPGALIQEATAIRPSETAPPIMLPAGTVLLEENVLQQFMSRFQLGRRLAESKINIKLHPAELGELKIDLTVKEGAIKANVVAQSQQVQEIIERNIARLRTLLEGQGFSLDSVTVTTESESVGDFDLFDRQLFSQHDDIPASPGIAQERSPILEEDSFFREGYPESTGVNVRI